MELSHRLVPAILSITKYSGNTKPNKQISASMFGDDMLRNYYRIKYGVIEDNETIIGANTLGTLAHDGANKLKTIDGFETNIRHTIEYNGYQLSAEVDIIDHSNKIIYDLKITKKYGFEHFTQDSQYANQMRLQKYIFSKVDKKYLEYRIFLFMILKDNPQREMFLKSDHRYIEVTGYSKQDIEETTNEKINILDQWLDDETKLERCTDLWWRKKDNVSYPSKCTKYCSYNKVCTFYKQKETKVNAVSKWAW